MLKNKIIKSFSQKAKNISFIGLGNMGLPMATNLLNKGGHHVTGFDLNSKTVDEFVKKGGKSSANFEKTISESDVIITMLPAYTHLKASMDSFADKTRTGTLIIDSSTISPIEAKANHSFWESKGIISCDAPVSGGVPGAIEGTINFFVGTDEKHFDGFKTVLQPMAKTVFYCGEAGCGAIVKICNNLTLAIYMLAASESLSLGTKLGIDPKVLTNCLSVSTARGWCMDTSNPVPNVLPNAPSSRNYERGFANKLISKDLGIILDTAEKVGLDLEIGKKAKEYYQTLVDNNLGDKDFGYVFQYILNNKKL